MILYLNIINRCFFRRNDGL